MTIPKAAAALTLKTRDEVVMEAMVVIAANQAEVEEEATPDTMKAVLPMADVTKVPTTVEDSTTAMKEMTMIEEITVMEDSPETTGIVEAAMIETLETRSRQPMIKDTRQPQTAA